MTERITESSTPSVNWIRREFDEMSAATTVSFGEDLSALVAPNGFNISGQAGEASVEINLSPAEALALAEVLQEYTEHLRQYADLQAANTSPVTTLPHVAVRESDSRGPSPFPANKDKAPGSSPTDSIT